nr:EOG090X0BJA [Eulimnadia texana]
MPRSKRFKKVSLTQTKKKGLDWKQKLVEDVRSCADKYSNLFLFSVQNMRNSKLKQIRNQWKDSRFFLGKNRVLAFALGKGTQDECKENISEISKRLTGQCGLLFTDKSKDEVSKFFEDYVESDYARAGNMATETITLPAGPLEQFPFNMEPYLRQLGLPTSLQKGVVTLIKEHTVCKEGTPLTPEQARILKLLGTHMAEFRVTVEASWSKDGTFEDFGGGRMVREKGEAKTSVRKVSADVEMDEDDDNEEDDDENDVSE